MDIDLENRTGAVECPNCQAAIEVEVGQIIAEEVVVCQNCQTEVQLRDKRGAVSKAEAQVEEALERLDQAIEDSGSPAN